MRIKLIIWVFLCFLVRESKAQNASSVQDFAWLTALIDSIEHETTLCSDCAEYPEIKSYFSSGEQRFRLRYSCSATTSVTRYYDGSGASVGVCIVEENFRDCEDVSAYTSFTFGTDIQTYWSCEEGTICEEEMRLGLFPEYMINIVDAPCDKSLKNVSVSTDFVSYEWIWPSGVMSTDSSLQADESGAYRVIVENSSGCFDTTEVMIDLISENLPQIQGDTILCDSNGVSLTIDGFEQYEWSNGATQSSTVYFEPGWASVRLIDENQCEQTANLFLHDYSDRTLELSVDQDPVYEHQNVMISYNVNWNFNQAFVPEHQWSINGTLIDAEGPSIVSIIPNETRIKLSLEDEVGCDRTDELLIIPEPVSKVFYAPNVVHPFSTTQNDRFYIQAPSATIGLERLIIYNRWGQPVYENNDPRVNDYDSGWDCRIDGELLTTGTYIYFAEMVFLDGNRSAISGEFAVIY